jgi:hypothetical protein
MFTERSEGLTPEEAEEFKKLLEEIKNEVQKL